MRTLLLALALALFSPALLHAQTSDASRAATARALFTEGVALARAGDYAAAVDRFRRSSALHPSAPVTFNLASALAHDGAVVEASELLAQLLRDATLPDALRHAAEHLQGETVPRIARLTVRADGSSRDVRIELDGEAVDDAALGVPLAVDPREHEVRARRAGETIATERVTASDGEHREVVLTIPALPAPAPTPTAPIPAAALAPTPTASEVDAPAPGNDDGAWIAVGVAIGVVLAGGAVTAIVLTTTPTDPMPVAGTAMPGVLTW